jgi:hypothetical protein
VKAAKPAATTSVQPSVDFARPKTINTVSPAPTGQGLRLISTYRSRRLFAAGYDYFRNRLGEFRNVSENISRKIQGVNVVIRAASGIGRQPGGDPHE